MNELIEKRWYPTVQKNNSIIFRRIQAVRGGAPTRESKSISNELALLSWLNLSIAPSRDQQDHILSDALLKAFRIVISRIQFKQTKDMLKNAFLIENLVKETQVKSEAGTNIRAIFFWQKSFRSRAFGYLNWADRALWCFRREPSSGALSFFCYETGNNNDYQSLSANFDEWLLSADPVAGHLKLPVYGTSTAASFSPSWATSTSRRGNVHSWIQPCQ